MELFVVAMEACGGAYFWGRQIGNLGHNLRLIPPAYFPQDDLNRPARRHAFDVDGQAYAPDGRRGRHRGVSRVADGG